MVAIFMNVDLTPNFLDNHFLVDEWFLPYTKPTWLIH